MAVSVAEFAMAVVSVAVDVAAVAAVTAVAIDCLTAYEAEQIDFVAT